MCVFFTVIISLVRRSQNMSEKSFIRGKYVHASKERKEDAFGKSSLFFLNHKVLYMLLDGWGLMYEQRLVRDSRGCVCVCVMIRVKAVPKEFRIIYKELYELPLHLGCVRLSFPHTNQATWWTWFDSSGENGMCWNLNPSHVSFRRIPELYNRND